jgi:mannose-6-phosphate isomerase-like protein (cupin superfamily)
VVHEARIEDTGAGLLPAGEGWFVINARDYRWGEVDGQRKGLAFEGERYHLFRQVGIRLRILEPAAPMSRYHWETDEEDFLVLAGEALLVVEGQERPLRQWDFVHCPPRAQHVLVGAGDGPCTIFCVGSRMRHTALTSEGELEGAADWGAYTVDETAARYRASVEEETTDADVAYAGQPEPRLTRYRDGWLPW